MRFLQFGDWKRVGADRINKSQIQIVAATNKDINDPDVFAPDLRDRFHEVVCIPPLRERRDDIEPLVDYFLLREGKDVSFAKDIYKDLIKYPWPGNVRQLEMWIQRICRAYNDVHIEWEDIPDRLRPDGAIGLEDEMLFPDFPIDFKEYTENLKLRALEIAEGNKSKADRLLGFKAGTIKQWMFQREKRNQL